MLIYEAVALGLNFFMNDSEIQVVAKVIQEKMNELEGIKEPELEDEVKAKLGEYREMLSKESND